MLPLFSRCAETFGLFCCWRLVWFDSGTVLRLRRSLFFFLMAKPICASKSLITVFQLIPYAVFLALSLISFNNIGWQASLIPARTNASAFCLATVSPLSMSTMCSCAAPWRNARTPSPLAIASMTTLPKVSKAPGNKNICRSEVF